MGNLHYDFQNAVEAKQGFQKQTKWQYPYRNIKDCSVPDTSVCLLGPLRFKNGHFPAELKELSDPEVR